MSFNSFGRSSLRINNNTLNERKDSKDSIVTHILVYEAGLALTIGQSSVKPFIY